MAFLGLASLPCCRSAFSKFASLAGSPDGVEWRVAPWLTSPALGSQCLSTCLKSRVAPSAVDLFSSSTVIYFPIPTDVLL